MRIREAFSPLIDLVFPPRCPLCGDMIATQTGLCADCWSELALPGTPACASCGRPFAHQVAEGSRCAPCLKDPPRHDGIASATLYNAASRKLVLALKHGNRIGLAPLLAQLMLARLPFLDEHWLVVPVPLHRWRLWQRGYNQSAELAKGLAQPRGARLLPEGLVRTKSTPSLGGLGAVARKRALSGAICVNPRMKAKFKGAQVVVVDDVMTSGATTDACVSALKKAGAKRVVIACFARVLDEALSAT